MRPTHWGGVGLGSDGIFRVDASALRAWMSCSTQAWLRYARGLTTKGEKAALLAGTAGHAALEAYFRSDGDAKAGRAAFDEVYKAWATQNVAGDDRLAHQNVSIIMRRWFEAHERKGGGKYANLPWTVVPEYVEVPFELELAEGIHLIGKIDLLPQYNNGFVVVETKTTGSINSWWTAQWKLAAQLTTYLWAARQCIQERVLGVFVNAIEFGKIPSDPSRRCKTHGKKYAECGELHAKWEVLGLYERPGRMIEEWHQEAVQAATKMRAVFEEADSIEDVQRLSQEGMFNGSCRGCEYAEGVCDLGRQPHMIEANLVEEWWNPLQA
ncbi:PD-(D/E)XK nuclease family protein [Nitrospira sp. BLG_1]|uniref:PD-(D/E)XK nuclease family protein n=1 Tax=Nitrospira sp. BLG_1 TaxID=3395883 RepID=UPI0039BD6021